MNDVKININNANKYELYNYENIFLINQNNSHYIINFVDWNSLFEQSKLFNLDQYYIPIKEIREILPHKYKEEKFEIKYGNRTIIINE